MSSAIERLPKSVLGWGLKSPLAHMVGRNGHISTLYFRKLNEHMNSRVIVPLLELP